MMVANRTRASSDLCLFLSFSLSLSWNCVCACGRGCLSLSFKDFFYPYSFLFVCVRARVSVCRCMSWGFEIYKAGLLMQSMPTSGKHLGGKKWLHVVWIPQGTEKNKLETVEMQIFIFYSLEVLRFSLFSVWYFESFCFWVLRHYCEKKKKNVVVQYLIQTCTTS